MRKLVIALTPVGLLSLAVAAPAFAYHAEGDGPRGFDMKKVDKNTDPRVDRNGDGFICFKGTKGGHDVVIDNRLPE